MFIHVPGSRNRLKHVSPFVFGQLQAFFRSCTLETSDKPTYFCRCRCCCCFVVFAAAAAVFTVSVKVVFNQ